MLTDADWTRVAQHVLRDRSGTARATDAAWIDADPERRALAWLLFNAHAAARVPHETMDVERAWSEFRESVLLAPQIARGGDRYPEPRPSVSSTRAAQRRRQLIDGQRGSVGIAAALVLAAVGTGAWLTVTRARRPIEMRTVATQAGQCVTLTMRDGTRITLGPASTLRYPRQFGDRSRTVELEGEGFFEVHHDPGVPLIVHTPRAQAVDLGTTFVVRDYAADSEPRVAVTEGEVSIAPAATGGQAHSEPALTVLRRGEIAALTPAGSVLVEQHADAAAEASWTSGELVFRHQRLREVLPELNRWFDVDVRLGEPSLGALEVTTSFKDESVTEAISALTAALGLVASRDGREIVLRRGHSVLTAPSHD